MNVLAPSRGVRRPPGPTMSTRATIRSIRRHGPTGLLEDVQRQYPRIAYFRFGTEHAYLLSEPDLTRLLLVDSARATAKGRGLERAREVLGNGLLTSEGETHRRQRRLVQPAFHGTRIAGYAEVMAEEAHALSATWRPGQVVDMPAEMSRLTLRIVARSLFGTDFSEQDIALVADSLTAFLGSFLSRMMPIGALLGRLPTAHNRSLHTALDQLDRLVYRLIAAHRASGDTGDLLSMLLLSPEHEQGMSDQQVRDEVLTLMLAGHETTADAMCWTWLLLARNPDIATRLREALAKTPPDPAFPRAVIAESMRLRPPAWLVSRRALAPLTIDGWLVPPGSLLAASQWLLHRDPRWWGDALAFRPERWLAPDGTFHETAPGQPRGAYFPFGAGRRVCIGEHFAWSELVLVLGILAVRWQPEVLPETSDATLAAVTLRPACLPMRLRLWG